MVVAGDVQKERPSDFRRKVLLGDGFALVLMLVVLGLHCVFLLAPEDKYALLLLDAFLSHYQTVNLMYPVLSQRLSEGCHLDFPYTKHNMV